MILVPRWLLIALVIVTGSLEASAQSLGTIPQSIDCTSGESEGDCGLPGIDLHTRYESLDSAINKIGSGYYFPVDVLAASFGGEDEGWKITLRPWLFVRSRMERTFSRDKRLMIEPVDPPASVAISVPGIGPRVYDADLVRALFATELFPYRMKIVSEKRDHTRVSFVALEPEPAGLVKACFKEVLDKNATKCPQALTDYQNRMKAGQTGKASSSPASHLFGNRLPPDSLYTPADSSDDKGQSNVKAASLIEGLLTFLPGENDETVRLIRRWNSAEEICSPNQAELEKLPSELHDKIKTSRYCVFDLDLDVPRSAANDYGKIILSGAVQNSKETTFVYLVPPAFKTAPAHKTVTASEETPRASNFSWTISGPILFPSPRQENTEEFIVVVPIAVPQTPKGAVAGATVADTPPSAASVVVKFFLDGYLLGREGEPPRRRYWCFPTACP
jgi:hypothetical protein